MRNSQLEYRCQWTNLRVERPDTAFSSACPPGKVLRIPISHGEGNYFADHDILRDMEQNGQVVFRYADLSGQATVESNPNGSMNNIAGIINREGNVLGMMPHPERSCEGIMGGIDGRLVFESIVLHLSGLRT